MQPIKENRVVQRTIVVNADIQRAFQVFTQNMGQWWPKEHHIGKSSPVAVVVEPRARGRWYEKGEDGAECEWGTVVQWEPPTRVVLSWHLNGDWQYVPDIARASEIEVRFLPEPEGRTRVVLEHRHFERHGETGDRVFIQIQEPGAWTYVLGEYGKLLGGILES